IKRDENQEIKKKLDDSMLDEIKNRVSSTVEWKVLQSELLEEELNFFLHRYAQLIKQFNNDILPSEETSIFHMVKIEVLMSRNFKTTKFYTLEINRLESIISDLYLKENSEFLSNEVRENLESLESQLQLIRSQYQAKTTELIKLQEKHSSLLRELKATRDQRIENIKSEKKNYLDIVVALQNAEYREQEARQAELMRLAVLKEKKRLSQDYQYLDGNFDKPLLSAETVEEMGD
ncbi:MAG: hypothetical protein SNJ71_00420, partial [Bacteroidales bacterium]